MVIEPTFWINESYDNYNIVNETTIIPQKMHDSCYIVYSIYNHNPGLIKRNWTKPYALKKVILLLVFVGNDAGDCSDPPYSSVGKYSVWHQGCLNMSKY